MIRWQSSFWGFAFLFLWIFEILDWTFRHLATERFCAHGMHPSVPQGRLGNHGTKQAQAKIKPISISFTSYFLIMLLISCGSVLYRDFKSYSCNPSAPTML